MQTKFKVGDKVRCIDCLPSQYIKLGEVYTVKNIMGGCIELEEIEFSHDYLATRFELLLEPNPVLTPEEVFEHLRKGTKLQLQNSHSGKWYNAVAPEYVSYVEITTKQWRVKPEPEVIELNGKRYKLIEE